MIIGLGTRHTSCVSTSLSSKETGRGGREGRRREEGGGEKGHGEVPPVLSAFLLVALVNVLFIICVFYHLGQR